MQLELHRIVPGHLPAVFEAQYLLQGQFRVQRPVRGLGALRGNPETPVVPRQKLLQHAVGFADAAGARQTQFCNQPVLEGSRRSFHSPLCLRREGEYHLYTQLVSAESPPTKKLSAKERAQAEALATSTPATD